MTDWPKELTPELTHILGRPNFTFIKLANVYRAAGFNIDTQAEAEQAFFLHRLVGFWFEHGAGWIEAAQRDLDEAREKAALKARHTQAGDGDNG